MRLFDQLKNSLSDQTGVPAGAEHSALANAAMQMFGNQHGLSGLAQGFERAGLGQVFASWVGTGTNEPVSANNGPVGDVSGDVHRIGGSAEFPLF